MTTTTRTNDDDLLALIAEFKREEEAQPEFDVPDADRERLRALADQIEATVPVTLAGVLALLEFADFESEPATLSAVTGLRAIMGKGNAAGPDAAEAPHARSLLLQDLADAITLLKSGVPINAAIAGLLDNIPVSAPRGETTASTLTLVDGVDDPIDKARTEMDCALVEVLGVSEVLRNLGDPDLAEVLGYLFSQLDAHRMRALDAYARIFGLNEYNQQRGGPGPLMMPAASAERDGGAA